ncbi:MAG: helicase-exonuclease AddAB subunit AddA, partial [Oscillospiraceae bacterium]|nr:helicase-exonuclease AddAB subunit AddA [Oscillospiraceae bacterium]
MEREIKYTPQQQAAIENRGGALLVSAAAGSGKTRVLVERLMRYVHLEHVDIDRFLIITYTRAAAGELRTRIMQEISKAIAKSPEDRHLRRQLSLCQRAQISTIHSFCSELIRENAQALNLAPDFRVADDEEMSVLQNEVLERLLEEKYKSIISDESFKSLVDTIGAGRNDSGLMRITLELHTKLQSHAFKEQWIQHQKENAGIALEGITDISQTVYGRYLIGVYRRTAEYWLERMTWAYEQIQDDADIMKGYGEAFSVPIEKLRRFIGACSVGWDEMLKCSDLTSPRAKAVRGKEFDDIKAIRTKYNADIKSGIVAKLDGTSEELLADMRAVAPAVQALLDLVLDFDRAFAEAKRRRGIIDYSDQEHMALSLLYDDDRKLTDIARAISRRFTEVLIDEYQDVNSVKEMIFNAVSTNGSNIFMVGDVKQSIYRFRLSDPGIFLEKYRNFVPYTDAARGDGRVVSLSSNFRSRDGIIDAVNFVFENIMSEELGDIEYTDDHALHCGTEYFEREEPDTHIHILSLEGDSESDTDEDAADVSEYEAQYVARLIKDMLSSGYQVSDGSGGRRPVRCSDIAILLRSTKDRAWKYAYALSKLSIPVTAEQQSDILDCTEVSVLLSLLAIIDNPAQDIPLISTMSSPLYGFTSDELAQIRAADKTASFYDALKTRAQSDKKCADFIGQIEAFREASYNMPADKLIWHVFDEIGILGIMGAMKGGEARRGNLMAVYEYAKTCEEAGYRGIFSFMLNIRRLMESGDGINLKKSSSGDNAVTIMSIHKSKGLEFPVVILPNLQKRFNRADSSASVLLHSEMGIGTKLTDKKRGIRYSTIAHRAISEKILDESLSEEMRVLYVAMTRAKECLIMTAAYKNAEKKLSSLCQDASLPVRPEVLRSNTDYASWILLAALNRPELEPLRYGVPVNAAVIEGKRWGVKLVRKTEIFVEAAQPAVQREMAADTDEIYNAIQANLQVNASPRTAVPSKITATELKGRYLDSETQQDAQR